MNSSISSVSNAKEVVLSFVKALNNEDFSTARTYVNDNMSFKGVLGSREGSEAYFRDMESMRLKYDIMKTFVDGEDVCLLYNLDMLGLTIFGCDGITWRMGK
jgi:hypothetical protein